VPSIDEMLGFFVSDCAGRKVGRVECPMYGTEPDVPDSVAVVSEGLLHHHFVVPAGQIRTVDALSGQIVLSRRLGELRRFL
jgi:hypothetical protein